MPFAGSGYQPPREALPERLREMRHLYQYGRETVESRAENSYRQAVFMRDYEDDAAWSGDFSLMSVCATATLELGIDIGRLERDFDPLELVYPKEVPVFEKYDEYVPEELVRKGFACGVLDVDGMKQRIQSWKKFGGKQDEA